MVASAQTTARVWHFIGFLAVACALWTHNASAQTRQKCTEQIQERIAAMGAKDWPSLDKLARRSVQTCNGVVGALDLSQAYQAIAIANLAMHHAQDALEAANSCIKTYYANPGCHFQKAQALLALNRLIEARDLLDIAERLAKSSIEQNDSALRTTYNSSERELYLALKNEYEFQLRLIKALRVQYFSS